MIGVLRTPSGSETIRWLAPILEGFPTAVQKRLSSRSERYPPRRTCEKIDTKDTFELADLGAEDLLGHVHPTRRGGKTQPPPPQRRSSAGAAARRPPASNRSGQNGGMIVVMPERNKIGLND